MSNRSHVDLPPSYLPNLSASGLPTKMHEAFGVFTKNSSGGGDTLSVKSAAVHKEYMGPPPGAKSLLSSNGEPSAQLQHLSLSVLDAFGSVHDILQQTDLKHASLTKSIGKKYAFKDIFNLF